MNRIVDNSFMENEFTIHYGIKWVTPRRGAGRHGAQAERGALDRRSAASVD
jgi:hypothetical protein